MTSLVIHVSQDLGTTDPDTISTGKDGLRNVTTEFETCRHVGEETSLVRQMNELDSVGKGQLQYLFDC